MQDDKTRRAISVGDAARCDNCGYTFTMRSRREPRCVRCRSFDVERWRDSDAHHEESTPS